MSTIPVASGDQRYVLISQTRTGKAVWLPYTDIQGEWRMNNDADQLRFNVSHRENPHITQENFYPALSRILLFDKEYSMVDPIWAGWLNDVTANSGDGTLSSAAVGYLDIFKNRILKVNKTYTGLPSDAISDLLTYTNGVETTGITLGTVTPSTTNQAFSISASERRTIADLWADLSDLGEGVDYWFRYSGGAPTLKLRRRNAVAVNVLTAWYGENLNTYSLTWQASSLVNDMDVANQNGLIGNAVDITSFGNYGRRQKSLQGSNATTLAALNASAAQKIKGKTAPIAIPQLSVGSAFQPFIHFDLNWELNLGISDSWAQINTTVRIVGFQMTISKQQRTGVTLYINDLSAVA